MTAATPVAAPALLDTFARRHRLRAFEALPWLAAVAAYFVFPDYLALGAQILATILFALTFALGSGLAALGGALGADFLPIVPGYALGNLVYFLIVVAVGGLGSIRGPFAAALLVGMADTAFKYIAPELGAFFIYALTMAILLWRPRGLFGRA
jgi:branched-chain amino acid transport system permease protein